MNRTLLFLSRQPIINAKGDLVAYELLFRSPDASETEGLDQSVGDEAAIHYAVNDLGIETALDGKHGFLDISAAALHSDAIKLLPPARMLLQLPSTVAMTPETVARCEQLINDGYSLVLRDVASASDTRLSMLSLFTVVKIDVPAVPPEALPALVQRLRATKADLLAENIDTAAQNRLCQELEFDFYQGYFFARPVILPGATVQSSSLLLLKLVSLLAQDAATELLEDALKHAPDLTLRLLKTVNSAALSRTRRIESVRNAILVLGRAQLSRLVHIMMYRNTSREDTGADPVTQLAITRGRLMETVAQLLGWQNVAGQAFMTGMLSLVDTLFGQELPEIIRHLELGEAMKAALLRREGRLGLLLDLAEASELQQSGRARELMAAMGLHDLDAFNRLQIEALKWASTF